MHGGNGVGERNAERVRVVCHRQAFGLRKEREERISLDLIKKKTEIDFCEGKK